MSSEVGSGHVSIFPVMTGFKARVARETQSAGQSGAKRFESGFKGAGAKSGRALGSDLKKALSSSAGDLGAAETKKLTGAVASASSALARVRLKQQDDAGKVRVAETKLAEAVAKSGATSSQAVAAEERLASARRNLQVTTAAVTSASSGLKGAQDALRRAQDAATSSSTRAAGGLRGLIGQAKQFPTNAIRSFGSGLASLPGRAASAFGGVVSAASRAGTSAGRALSTGIKSTATAGVAGVAAGIGVAFGKGLGRLAAIDTARAKLTGLGNDSKAVDSIMKNALASVKGTAFGLGEAATVAAGAVAAGIKPGQQLESTLKGVANVAAASGASMEETGNIFNKVASSGRAYTDNLNQLADRGIPIYQALSKELGITTDQVRKMATDGKIDFATFQKAAAAAAGTVATEMSKTVPGAAKNFFAAMGRIGANALGPIYARIAPLIQAATSALGPIETRAKAFGEVLLKVLGPALDFVTNLLSKIGQGATLAQAGLGGLSGLLAPLAGAFAALGAGGLAGLLTRLPVLGSLLGGIAGPLAALGGPLGVVAAGLGALFLSGGDLGQVTSAVTGLVSNVVSALPGLVQQVASFVPKIVAAILAQVPALLTAGLQIVMTLIQGIVSAVPALVQGALSLIMGLTTAIIANLPLLVQGALALVTGLVQGLITALPLLVQGAVTLVTALVTGLITMLPAIVQGGLTLLTGLLTAIVAAIPIIVNGLLQLLPQLLTTLLGMLPSLLQTGIQLFVGIVTALVQVIPQLISTLVGLLPKILQTLVGMLPKLLETGVQLFIQLVTAVVKVLPKLLTSIIQMLPKIISTVIGMIPELLKAAIDLFTSLVKALPKILPELIGALIKLGPELVGAVISLVPQLISAGVDLVRGLANGIRDAGQVVLDAIGGVVNGAIDWAKSLLGIKSPSRVFMAIGKYVGQGFVKGVTGTREQVSTAMTKLVDLVKSSFDKVIDQRKSANAKLVALEKKRAKIDQQIDDARSIKDKKARARRLRDLRASRTEVSKQITSQRKVVSQYDKAIRGGRTESALLTRINADNKKLADLAKQRENVTARLKTARESLKGLQDARASVIQGIQSSVVALGNIGGQSSSRGMIRNLQDQIKATQQFFAKLKTLQAQGLDDTSRDQLLADFQQTGSLSSVNALIKGGPATVKEIAKLQGQLSSEGKKLGTYVGDDMYKAGINAAQGLVNGLESQLSKIDTASKRIADALVKAVKKALKIKSPSRVTMALGGHTGEGFAIGLEDKARRVQQAAERMLPTITPTPFGGSRGADGLGGASAGDTHITVQALPGMSPQEQAELIVSELRWTA